MKEFEWYVGIDEVGRGPLAGPVAVCAVAFNDRKIPFLKGIKDSKKLKEKERILWSEIIKQKKDAGDIIFSVQSCDSGTIDELGIVPSIELSILGALKEMDISFKSSMIFLDGGLRAPKEYLHQETIVKGDEKEPLISAASVVAKVYRDEFMTEQSFLYPEYGFSEHKGYGTSAHYEAIKKYGLCKIHRRSFLSNFL